MKCIFKHLNKQNYCNLLDHILYHLKINLSIYIFVSFKAIFRKKEKLIDFYLYSALEIRERKIFCKLAKLDINYIDTKSYDYR